MWAQGLRPATRRDRILGVLVLGLGCGLRASELTTITPESVTVDEYGVHVTVVTDRGTRVVTCDRVWEDRLLDLVANTEPGHPLTSPWRAEPDERPRAPERAGVRPAHRTRRSRGSRRGRCGTRGWWPGSPRAPRSRRCMDAAGLESIEALKAFLVYVPALSPAERAAALRGHGIPGRPGR